MNRPQAMQMQANLGRSRVLAEYNWDGLATKLEEVWQSAAAEMTNDRRMTVE
jgi:hypothetical protein